MGTSQSKPSARGGSPLVPSWAEQDPTPQTGQTPQQQPAGQQATLEARRNAGFRRSLKQYLKTGDDRYARRALGYFARGSMGGGSAAGQRLARAARVGGDAISALASASGGQAPAAGGLDLRTLTGKSVSEAISNIVDAFCPSGILDEDAIRAAMSEALAETLSGLDTFDPTMIDDHAIVLATCSFIAELVFLAVTAEQGQAASDTPPQQAIVRENHIRDIIREITDVQATPAIQAVGPQMTSGQIEGLVKKIAVSVYEEMATW